MRGVISESDLLNVSAEEILENMRDQKVCGVRRIPLRWNGQALNTIPLILTFSMSSHLQSVKAAYLHCLVRPCISNTVERRLSELLQSKASNIRTRFFFVNYMYRI
ncbi:hypothetical protein TNCV_2273631 [Trichonephila clavipes]|nr:hypothetical protein TNCV_2273631 [Trichonephila clavipes]